MAMAAVDASGIGSVLVGREDALESEGFCEQAARVQRPSAARAAMIVLLARGVFGDLI
jgi:hypothetical protein